jgi:dihydrofolate synthase/folylpolyglutamate synthase
LPTINYLDFLKEYEGMQPGLLRIRQFLSLVNNPQNSFSSVQIAGTNGKGSTALFLSNILEKHKYKVGLYTSPHLLNICERIKINEKEISKKALTSILKKYFPYAKDCTLSYFEYLTAAAFIYFAHKKVDIAVLETGLGGRFDATNVVDKSLGSIISSISFDHQEILGNSLSEIAFEKAGIIKKKSFTVCADLPNPALKEILKKTNPYIYGKDFKVQNIRSNSKYQEFDYLGLSADFKNLKIAMHGHHQIHNAAIALCAAELLLGSNIYKTAIAPALLTSINPARFDIRKVKLGKRRTELIIDGAHNEEGLLSFINTLKTSEHAKDKIPFIFATMKEKSYEKMVKTISTVASKVILPQIKNPRAVQPAELKKLFLRYADGIEVIEVKNTKRALDKIKDEKRVAVIGSLYLAGEVLKYLH